jgi:hypothetical protein
MTEESSLDIIQEDTIYPRIVLSISWTELRFDSACRELS